MEEQFRKCLISGEVGEFKVVNSHIKGLASVAETAQLRRWSPIACEPKVMVHMWVYT